MVGVLADERDDQWEGRSSSAPKKAACKIELARRTSATSRLSQRTSADCSLVAPGRQPVQRAGVTLPAGRWS